MTKCPILRLDLELVSEEAKGRLCASFVGSKGKKGQLNFGWKLNINMPLFNMFISHLGTDKLMAAIRKFSAVNSKIAAVFLPMRKYEISRDQAQSRILRLDLGSLPQSCYDDVPGLPLQWPGLNPLCRLPAAGPGLRGKN